MEKSKSLNKKGYESTIIFLLTVFSVFMAGAQNSPRSVNLGVSGPTMEAVGGPGSHFLKYNTNPDAGRAVRNGLMPPIRPLIDA